MNFDYSILIGRFQPFHNEHLKLLKRSLAEAKQVIVVLGSYRTAPNFKNPWSVEDRRTMITDCLDSKDVDRIRFVAVRDHLYNDDRWLIEVQQKINMIVGDTSSKKVCLNGNFKDETSYYLNMFPQWKFIGDYVDSKLDATNIREEYFHEDHGWGWVKDVPSPIVKFLEKYEETESYKNIKQEYSYIREYKSKWDDAPFKPTFITTDAVVVKSGHILVVKRGVNPGKGLLALPGGFLDNDITILHSCLRELKEETVIMMPPDEIKYHLKENQVFDHPQRSLRGRTITHAFFFKLPDKGELPKVCGGDDAKEAFWLPIGDLYLRDDEFFEDHIHIINHFINKA